MRTDTNVKVLYKNGDRIYIYTQFGQLPDPSRWQGLAFRNEIARAKIWASSFSNTNNIQNNERTKHEL